MNFRFNLGKATEAASLFLEKAGGRMNVMKLVKLMYLLDRLSLSRRNIPVSGGDYLSMRNGPVTSEVLDLINAGRLVGEDDQRWEKSITSRRDHDLELQRVPPREHLSEAEVALVNEIWNEHGNKDQWQLVDWCHEHCGEWTPLSRGSAPISVERMALALGKSPELIRRITHESLELNRLDQIFAAR